MVEGDREAAEMLHTFFRLMELDCSLIGPDSAAVPTLRRLDADVVIVDFDLPDLRALELAREIRALVPRLPIIFLTAARPAVDVVPFDAPVMALPHTFEELLRLFEMVLEMEL